MLSLSHTPVEEHEKHELHSNAGIICYAVVNNEPLVVLGREQFTKGWSGSLKWSEFGGQTKEFEMRDSRLTAEREFLEETMGVFGPIDLTNDAYHFSITMKRTTPQETYKVYYFVQIPWIDTYRDVFHKRRDHLRQILQLTAQLRDLQRDLSQERLPVPDFPFRLATGLAMIVDIHSVQRDNEKWTVSVDACVSNGTAYFKWCPKTATRTTCNIDIVETAVVMYNKIFEHKIKLATLLASDDLLRGAIYYNDNRPWLPFVRREYLEKDDIYAWPLDEITTIKNLRAGFSATLKLCFDAILKDQ
jgi:hypothetical protein